MAVFELEGNTSQDANYREHLDRNWLNGNSAFDQINQNIADWQNLISSLSSRVSSLSSRVSTLESENDKRIQEITGLRNELTATDQRLQRLEDAIFNAEYINDTDDKPNIDHSTKVSEINDDIVPDPSTNDSSAVVIESGNDVIIPDKIN